MSLKEKLTEAIEIKKNDVNSYVWKFPRNSGNADIKLMDASEEDLNKFYNHCMSMIYSNDKRNPGRLTLSHMIQTYRDKCTTELFLRQMEDGSLLSDGKPYSRQLYYQDLMDTLIKNKEQLPKSMYKTTPISVITQGLPREYERLSIQMVLDACIDKLGALSFKHISYNFILGLGVYLTPEELVSLKESGVDISKRNIIETIKEKLFINKNSVLKINPSGLSCQELRIILELKAISKINPKKYSMMSTPELLILRNKVLFRLEQNITNQAELWERKIEEIDKVAKAKGYTLNNE